MASAPQPTTVPRAPMEPAPRRKFSRSPVSTQKTNAPVVDHPCESERRPPILAPGGPADQTSTYQRRSYPRLQPAAIRGDRPCGGPAPAADQPLIEVLRRERVRARLLAAMLKGFADRPPIWALERQLALAHGRLDASGTTTGSVVLGVRSICPVRSAASEWSAMYFA